MPGKRSHTRPVEKLGGASRVARGVTGLRKQARRLALRARSWLAQKRATLRKMPRRIWAILGVIAVVSGLFFNIALDLPAFLSQISLLVHPLPFEKAHTKNNEVLVIVADFSGSDGMVASTRIFRSLSERVEKSSLAHVRVERYTGSTPVVAKDAVKIGKLFDATLVIWGTADGYGIEPRYEVVYNQKLVFDLPNIDKMIATDPQTFSLYVVEGMPAEYEYLMLLSLGEIAYYGGDPQQAADRFSDALHLNLGNRASALKVDYVHALRGNAYIDLKDYPAAIEDADQAIQLNPGNAFYFFTRALAHDFSGQTEQALTDYHSTFGLDPQYSPAYTNAGIIERAMGRNAEALENYQKAIATGNDDIIITYLNRANLYSDLGDFEHAEADHSEAIKWVQKRPDSYSSYIKAMMWSARGRFYINNGKGKLAIADLNQAIKIEPDNLLHVNDRAVAYSEEGRYQEAVTDLTRIIRKDPNNKNYANTYSNRAGDYCSLGQFEKAIADFKRSIELDPSELRTMRSFGNCYDYMGAKREALQTWQQYVDLAGSSADPETIQRLNKLKAELGVGQ